MGTKSLNCILKRNFGYVRDKYSKQIVKEIWEILINGSVYKVLNFNMTDSL